MDPSFAKLLSELDNPRNSAQLRRSIEEAATFVRIYPEDALGVLRDPAWDRPSDLVGRWGEPTVKQILWKAVLANASSEEVRNLWILAEQTDVDQRADFIADALSVGHHEQLEAAGQLLADAEKLVREYAAIGLRNALRVNQSQEFLSAVADLLFDYVVAHPKDSDIARMMALRSIDDDRAAQAQQLIDESHRPTPSGEWFVPHGDDLGWGDYGAILVHGMTSHLGRDDQGRPQLERTGPFIPPVTLSGLGVLLVTGEARSELESSGLRSIGFGPVALARIVRLPWHEWDLDADVPEVYPQSGEPEDYILGRRHNAGVAAAMPEIFEVLVDEFTFDDSPPAGTDIYRRGPYQFVFSRRAKSWFEERWSRWIHFRDPPW